MGIDNFVNIRQRHAAVPDCIRINHQVGAVLALVKAARLVGAHFSLQPSLQQFFFEELLQLGFAPGIAAATRMTFRPSIAAYENVPFEFGHGNNVQENVELSLAGFL